MWNHSETMIAEAAKRAVPRVTFSGQEMTDTISYLYFINYTNVAGVPSRGEKVFHDRCAACHADVSAANEPFALIAAMWNHAPTMERELKKRGLTWPRLAPGEPADLAAFLISKHGPKNPVVSR
jgi:hypothetical protein